MLDHPEKTARLLADLKATMADSVPILGWRIGMRNMGMLVAIAFVVIPTVVSAETWTAHTIFEKEKSMSGGSCPQDAVSYTLDLTDNTFTATSQYGRMFSITVPPDGVINTTYKRVAPGTKWVTLQMTGNVKSRELEIVWWRCYWKLANVEPPLR